jgi:hypothetical protein
MTPQDKQNYGEAGNVTIAAADGDIQLASPLRFCKLVTLAQTTFTVLTDEFERASITGNPAEDQTYPANFELVGSFTVVHVATGAVRAYFAADRK